MGFLAQMLGISSAVNDRPAEPIPLPAQPKMPEYADPGVVRSYYTDVRDLMSNSRIVFTPLGVLLADLSGTTLYSIPQGDMTTADLQAFADRNSGYFGRVFAQRIAMSLQAAQTALLSRAMSAAGFPEGGMVGTAKQSAAHPEWCKEAAAQVSPDVYMDTGHCPHYYWDKLAFLPLTATMLPADSIARDCRVTFLPDRVLFAYGRLTLGTLTLTAMTEPQLEAFNRRDADYFRTWFVGNSQGALKFASESPVTENVPADPKALSDWLDSFLTNWHELDPEVLTDSVAERLGAAELDPVLESKILALCGVRNSDRFETDRVTLEKTLNAFNGNAVDFRIDQPIDTPLEIRDAFRALVAVAGRPLRLSPECADYVADLLFDVGAGLSPLTKELENNDTVNACLRDDWLPAVADVELVQTIARAAVDPADVNADAAVAVLSPEGRELLRNTLICLRAWRA